MRIRSLQWLCRALWLLGALVVLLSAALAMGEHYLERPLLRLLAARTGRQIRVDGAFEAHLFALHPRLTASRVSIGNPRWSPAGLTATIGRLSLSLRWQPSIVPVGIRRLEIEHAMLHLVRDAAGNANWHLHAGDAGSGPPVIQSLSMPDAGVELHDARRQLQFSGTVSAGDAPAAAGLPRLRITGAGQLNGRAASFQIDGSPLAAVRRDRPYEFRFEEHSIGTELVAQGSIERPFDFHRLQASFASSGSDLKSLYYLVGITLPDTGPYQLSGRLTRHGKLFLYSDLAATTGQSDMRGSLSVDSSSGRARIEGTLASQWLRLADFGARAGQGKPRESRSPGLRVPNVPLQLAGLRRTDMAVKFAAGALGLGALRLHSVTALVSIERGVLAVKAFKAAIGGGAVSASARLDAAHALPQGVLDLSVDSVSIEQLTGHSPGQSPLLSGLLSGRVRLVGEGASLHALAATATGTMVGVLPHGAIRTSVAELASLNLAGALRARLTPHEQRPIHCGVASFDARAGVVAIHTFVIDTDKVLITGTGDIHMDSEALDFELQGHPKPVGLRAVMSIRGTLSHPEVRPMPHEVLKAAAGIGLLPLASLFAFVDPKLVRASQCVSLLAAPP